MNKLLESDQKMINALPENIRMKLDGLSIDYQLQVAVAWSLKDNPLPDGYQPTFIELFVDGEEEPCLFVHENNVKSTTKSYFGDRISSTLLIQIDDEPRYVQLHGELIADSLGGCLLPDILVSPQAQLKILSELLK
jgi:hypothetical protein